MTNNHQQMYKFYIQKTLLTILIGILCLCTAEARQLSEQEKIEYLISHVGNLKDASFERNGRMHTPENAADHLQTKLRRARRHISTAEDFIRVCATQSSMTGRKYFIIFDDGRSYESGTYLKKVLAEIEASDDEVTD